MIFKVPLQLYHLGVNTSANLADNADAYVQARWGIHPDSLRGAPKGPVSFYILASAEWVPSGSLLCFG